MCEYKTNFTQVRSLRGIDGNPSVLSFYFYSSDIFGSILLVTSHGKNILEEILIIELIMNYVRHLTHT